MRVLVTGAAGFIGSTLADRLLADGHEVTAVDDFDPFYARAIKERNAASLRAHPAARFLELDLATADLSPLLDEVDGVVHLAARPAVTRSWGATFGEYLRRNVLATQRLLEAAVSAPRLRAWVYASSASVYGDACREAVREDAPTAPHSPYGVTKLAGEHLAQSYRLNHGVPTLCLRYFSVYGPRERPDKAIQRFLVAARDRREIEVRGDGAQRRDFTYVDDAVDATVRALDRAPVGETLNVARGEPVALSRVVDLVALVTDRPPSVRPAPPVRGDVRTTAASIDAAARVLGYAPQVGIAEGIRRQWAHVLRERPHRPDPGGP